MDAKKIEEAASAVTENTQKVAEIVAPVIKDWAKELLDWAKAGSALVQREVPLLVQEIIKWGFAEACLYMVLAVALFITGRYLLRQWEAKPKDSVWRDFDEGGPLPLVAGFGVYGAQVVGFFLFFDGLFTAVKTLVAPRVYLIEYLYALSQNTPK